MSIVARDPAHTRLLLSRHSTPPTPEGHPQPLLAYALINNDFSQFTFLLDCGANPNTPLNSPVEKSFNKCVQSAMMRDYLGSEPGMNILMLAAGLGKIDYIQALLQKGAKRGIASSRCKFEPLVFAAQAEDAPAMQSLIEGCPSPGQLHIEISLGSQEASVVKSGVPVLRTEISTGKPGYSTHPGDYVITDKHLVHRSTIYKVDMPYFMRLNCRDFGMHKGYVPGYPASHGCIRIPDAAARRMFYEIPVGTLVTIRE
jgi:hypothetical protein